MQAENSNNNNKNNAIQLEVKHLTSANQLIRELRESVGLTSQFKKGYTVDGKYLNMEYRATKLAQLKKVQQTSAQQEQQQKQSQKQQKQQQQQQNQQQRQLEIELINQPNEVIPSVNQQIPNNEKEQFQKNIQINEYDILQFTSKVIIEDKNIEMTDRISSQHSDIKVSNTMQKLENNIVERSLIIDTAYKKIIFKDIYELMPDQENLMQLQQNQKLAQIEYQYKKYILDLQEEKDKIIQSFTSQQNETVQEYETTMHELKQKLAAMEISYQSQQERADALQVISMQTEQKDVQIQQLQQNISQKKEMYEEIEGQIKLYSQINESLRQQLQFYIQNQPQQNQINNQQNQINNQQNLINNHQKGIEYAQPHSNQLAIKTFQTNPTLIPASQYSQNTHHDTDNSFISQDFKISPSHKPISALKQVQLNTSQLNSQPNQFNYSPKIDYFQIKQVSQKQTHIDSQDSANKEYHYLPKDNLNLIDIDDNCGLMDSCHLDHKDDINSSSFQKDNEHLLSLKTKKISKQNKNKMSISPIINNQSSQNLKKDKKNVSKNFMKAFRSFFNSPAEIKSFKELRPDFQADELDNFKKKFNAIFENNNINNEIIVFFIQNEEFSDIFEFFLLYRAGQWISDSQLKDKSSHLEALDLYTKSFQSTYQLSKVKVNQGKRRKPITIPPQFQ